jgi:hypothetical protein
MRMCDDFDVYSLPPTKPNRTNIIITAIFILLYVIRRRTGGDSEARGHEALRVSKSSLSLSKCACVCDDYNASLSAYLVNTLHTHIPIRVHSCMLTCIYLSRATR